MPGCGGMPGIEHWSGSKIEKPLRTQSNSIRGGISGKRTIFLGGLSIPKQPRRRHSMISRKPFPSFLRA